MWMAKNPALKRWAIVSKVKDNQLLLQVVHLDKGGAGSGTGASPVDDGGIGTTMQH